MGVRELRVKFTGDPSQLTGVFKQVEGLAGALPGPIGIAAAAVVGLGAGFFAAGEKFQGAFNKIKVGTGATGDQLKGLESSFKNVLAGTAGSFDQVEAAIEGISRRTGLSGAALDDFAKKEVTLGRITKTDVKENVEATTAVMAKFGVAAKDQSRELDVLFKASQFSGKSVADLSGEMANAEVSLHGIGLSFDQSAAIVAAFGKAGINTTGAFTGLRKEFVTLAKEGKDPIEGFRQLADRIKNAGSETEAFGYAAKAFGPKGIEMAKAIRDGTLNVDELAKSLASGKGGILDTASSVSTIGGKFARLKNEALVALEPIGMKLVDLANGGLGAVLRGIDRLKPAFKGISDILIHGDFTSAFRNAFHVEEDSGLVAFLFRVRDAAIGLFNLLAHGDFTGAFRRAFHVEEDSPLVAFLLNLRTTVQQVVDFVRDHAAPVFAALGVALLAVVSPVALVIGAIAALTAGAIYAYGHFAAFHKVIDQLADVFMSVFEVIRAVVEVAVTIISQLWDRFGEHLWSHIKVALDAVLQIIGGALEVVKGIFDVFAAIFTGDWSRLWEGIKEILGGLLDVIVGSVRESLNAISTVIGGVMAVISEIWSGTWHAIATLFDTVWDGIKSAVVGAVSFIVDKFLAMAEWVVKSAEKAFGWVPLLGGKLHDAAAAVEAFRDDVNAYLDGIRDRDVHVNIGYNIYAANIDPAVRSSYEATHYGLAEGGIVERPTLALIGEAGKELVLPLSDMARTSALLAQAGLLKPFRSASGGAAGAADAGPGGPPVVYVNVNVAGQVWGIAELAAAIRDELVNMTFTHGDLGLVRS